MGECHERRRCEISRGCNQAGFYEIFGRNRHVPLPGCADQRMQWRQLRRHAGRAVADRERCFHYDPAAGSSCSGIREVPQINPRDLALYSEFGYDAWHVGPGLPHTLWDTIAPDYSGAPNVARLLSFFTITDIHIADKESPAQPLYVGWIAQNGPNYNTSAYSPVLLASTHVLDAAMQTINAVHKISPFDFGISFGDACNNTQYNELRWYLDVIDGKVITPSSGVNIGSTTNDYQKPYKAAGLDRSIPWYQVMGNHDQFWMGSLLESAKTLTVHTSNAVINMGDDPASAANAMNTTGFYMGVIDGSDPLGAVIKSGPEGNFSTPPAVVADSNRRSLSTLTNSYANWIHEFFNTTSGPVGHGFSLVGPTNPPACYSFVPKSNIPIKVIVLDDTVKGPGQPNYAAGCIDQTRLDWLTTELQAGQDNNQLMIIAAHIPFNTYKNLVTDPAQAEASPPPPRMPLFIPAPIGGATSVVTDQSLLVFLQNFPNLIMWIAGHRHMNTVTPQIHSTDPTRSFWEVETSSLRDFPQQFRTFDIRRNSDNTVSIIITNVDPAVAAVSPATIRLLSSRMFISPPFTTRLFFRRLWPRMPATGHLSSRHRALQHLLREGSTPTTLCSCLLSRA